MALSKGSKGFLLALVVVGVLLAAGVAALGALTGGGSGEGEPVTVEIPEGIGASAVGDILADAGVVRSAVAFKIAARFDERAERIRTGTYRLRTGMGTDAALEELAAGEGQRRADSFRVTIPEGRTVTQTLERIAEAEGSPFTVSQLEAALTSVPLPDWVPSGLPEGPRDFAQYEGLLFPDTYEFRTDATAEDVLDRLVERTEDILESVDVPEGFTRYEVLILASLIEREARLPDEQRLVSAVLHNRLERPMRLQIDATVIYAHGEHLDRVLNRHLEIDSPWNTYRYDGLPPTPISGSGESAIRAAADPADEDYLYYVVVDPETGEHGFSRTLEEHNAKVREARQRRAE
ncbi:MAG TPA: endolytic transglycosylase MltG [Egibacteraceae bacterium]|nr:endolytic transglycosylase MltG [Egibacteraceae bacterium]